MSSKKTMDQKFPFTKREKEVLWLIVSEKTTIEISKILLISKSTIVSHRKSMLLKLKAKNTAGLICKCFQRGILFIDEDGQARMQSDEED